MNPSERFLILAAHWEPLKEFFYIPRPRPDGGLWVSAFKKKKIFQDTANVPPGWRTANQHSFCSRKTGARGAHVTCADRPPMRARLQAGSEPWSSSYESLCLQVHKARTEAEGIQLAYTDGTFYGFIFTFEQIFLVQQLSFRDRKASSRKGR